MVYRYNVLTIDIVEIYNELFLILFSEIREYYRHFLDKDY